MLDPLINIAREAGRRILEVYHSGEPEVQTKPDGSPITRADRVSHEYICEALEREFRWPVISEESEAPPYAERRNWETFFLVDPLDGTKDFIARNGEFTVNIALIRNREPEAGVVYVPASDELFYAGKGTGAWWRQGDQTRALPRETPEGRVLARSWFYDNPAVEAFARANGIRRNLKMSSAIRLPRLAEGRVNLCLVSNRSSEWDIAAGHCLVQETGGRLVELATGQTPCYNKPQLNNSFLLACGPQVALESLTTPAEGSF